MEKKFLDSFNEQLEILIKLQPESLRGREIRTLTRDMKTPIPELADREYDLAFCEDVLYSLLIQGGPEAVESGVQQMGRIVKPNGFVVAVEPKYGVEFETRRSDGLGIDLPIPIPASEPEDMSAFFSIDGFTRVEISESPPYTYSYQRTN